MAIKESEIIASIIQTGSLEGVLKDIKGVREATKTVNTDLKAAAQHAKELLSSYQQLGRQFTGNSPFLSGPAKKKADRENQQAASQAISATRSGGADTALFNAGTAGQIAKQNATAFNRYVAELTNEIGNMTKAVKLQTKRLFRDLVEDRSKSANLTGVNQLKTGIAASQFRETGLRYAVDSLPKNSLVRKTALKELEEEKKLQEELNAKIRQQTAAEKELTSVESRRARQQQELLNIAEKIRQAELQIVQAGIGGASAKSLQGLQQKRQSLVVAQEQIKAELGIANVLDHELVKLQQIKNLHEQKLSVQKQEAAESRKQQAEIDKAAKQNQRGQNPLSVIRKDPVELFKIQADLVANYYLMNQLFNLLQFGGRFVKELDEAFRDLQATARITEYQMGSLKEAIVSASQGTKFSAVEVARASVTMAQAGLSVKQIEKSIKPVILFATATGSDLASSVDNVTSVLSVFNRTADETDQIVNVMTGAINDSKLSIDKLTAGIQYAGNIAADSGAQFEEFVAILGAAANSGIKTGSTIGTGLRQILTEFQNPGDKLLRQLTELGISVTALDVRSHGLIGVFQNLAAQGFTTASAFKTMDIRAAAMFSAISRNLGLAEQLRRQFLLTNAATVANETQMKSLANTLSKFSNNLGIAIDKGLKPLSFMLQQIVEWGSDALEVLHDFPAVIGVITTAIAGLIGSLVVTRGIDVAGSFLGFNVKTQQTVINGVKSMTGGIKELAVSVRALTFAGLTAEVAGFAVALTAVTAPVTLVVGLLAGLAVAVGGVYLAFNNPITENLADKLDELRGKAQAAKEEYDEQTSKVNSLSDAMKELDSKSSELYNNQELLKTTALELQIKFGQLGFVFHDNKLSVDTLRDAVKNLRLELERTAATKAADAFKAQIEVLRLAAVDANAAGKAPGMSVKGFFNGTNDALTNSPMLSKLSNTLNGNVSKFFTQLQAIDPASLSQGGIVNIETQLSKARNTLNAIGKVSKTNIDELEKLAAKQIQYREGSTVTVQKELELYKQIQSVVEDRLRGLTKYGAEILKTFGLQTQSLVADLGLDQNIIKFSDEVEDLRKQLNENVTKLTEGKNLSSSEREDLKKKIDQIQAELAKYTVENMIKRLRDLAPGLFDNLLGGEESPLVSAILGPIEQTSATIRQEANNKQSQVVAQAAAEVENVFKQWADKIEKAGRAVKRAADATDLVISNLEFVIRETQDRERGGLRRIYSDADVEKFRDMQRNARIQQLNDLIPALVNQANTYQAAVSAARPGLNTETLNARSAEDRAVLAGGDKEVLKLLDQAAEATKQLTMAQQELAAMTGKAAEEQMSFGEALGYVMQKQSELNLLNTDFRLNIKRIVETVSGDASAAFSQFFQDISNGTKSVKEAFKSMGVSILGSMQKIVTDRLAAQFMGILGSFIPSFGSFGSTSIGTPSIGGGFSFDGFSYAAGGLVRAAAGRRPAAGRDSVPLLARPGEFMMREAAVQAIGVDNLRQMNAMGNRAVSYAPRDITPQRAYQETNVYVVPPETKPGLGPNDVLAIIQDDMMRGGATKKIVKSISQGAG